MEGKFSIAPHDQLPGKFMVEYWRSKRFVAGIYPHQDGIRIISKYMTGVSEETGFPPAAVIKLGDEELISKKTSDVEVFSGGLCPECEDGIVQAIADGYLECTCCRAKWNAKGERVASALTSAVLYLDRNNEKSHG